MLLPVLLQVRWGQPVTSTSFWCSSVTALSAFWPPALLENGVAETVPECVTGVWQSCTITKCLFIFKRKSVQITEPWPLLLLPLLHLRESFLQGPCPPDAASRSSIGTSVVSICRCPAVAHRKVCHSQYKWKRRRYLVDDTHTKKWSILWRHLESLFRWVYVLDLHSCGHELHSGYFCQALVSAVHKIQPRMLFRRFTASFIYALWSCN